MSRKNVHGLTQEVEDEHDCESTLFVGAITTEVQLQDDECYAMLAVQGHVVKLKVDTGAQVNILPIKELKRIVGSEPHLEPCKHKLVSYSETH